MKIEKLNENKIKITLDINDLKSRNIDAHSFMYNTPESQDLFWDVIQEAENKYGFSVEESMIYVEAHMSSTGTFTIIVTKQNQAMQSNAASKSRISKGTPYKLKRKTTNYSLNDSIYRFEKLEDLYEFCRAIKTLDISNNSLYIYNNKYYLVVDKISNFVILEYATKEQDKVVFEEILKEYGKLIYKNTAVESIKKII